MVLKLFVGEKRNGNGCAFGALAVRDFLTKTSVMKLDRAQY